MDRSLDGSKKIIVIGAGGHARVVVELARRILKRDVIYAVEIDSRFEPDSTVGEVEVISQEEAAALISDRQVTHFINGVGSVGSMQAKVRAFLEGQALHLQPLSLLHPNACCSPSAILGMGCQIMTHAVVGVEAVLGIDVLANTASVIDHGCVIGDHCHIAPGAKLCGNVRLGYGVHVGAGAVILQNVSIGDNAIVGAGTVVTRNVPRNCTVVGVPARILPAPARRRTAQRRALKIH